MVHLTDCEKKEINKIWSKLDMKAVGGDALCRLMCVYPWTLVHFHTFGDLGSTEAICHNAKVHTHGAKVLASIGKAIDHIDDVNGFYAELSKHHYHDLKVDPANFMLFCNCLLITMARCLREEFTPDAQDLFTRLFQSVAGALGKGYCH